MSYNKKIAIIIPFFGKWPKWFDYFLQTCMANPSIDWVFPTDCQIPKNHESNLQFVPITLKDFNVKASRKTGLNLDISHPYKICDLKPAYGDIFNELISGYDFWGYGDLDLVYGDIRSFYPDNLLDKYDIFSNHKDFITGHFCLLRNSPDIIGLYKSGDAYRKAFLDEYYVGFDEQLKKSGINPDPEILDQERINDRKKHISRFKLIKRIKWFSPLKSGIGENLKNKIKKGNSKSRIWIKDFSSIAKEAEQSGLIKVSYSRKFESDLMLEKRGKNDWEVKWQNNSLTNKEGKDLLYFHFILAKTLDSFKIMDFKSGINKFEINPGGFQS